MWFRPGPLWSSRFDTERWVRCRRRSRGGLAHRLRRLIRPVREKRPVRKLLHPQWHSSACVCSNPSGCNRTGYWKKGLKPGFLFVHPRKKLKGPKTQETENSRKKLKTQAENSVFRHFSVNQQKCQKHSFYLRSYATKIRCKHSSIFRLSKLTFGHLW